MKKNPPDMTTPSALHQAGQWDAARAGYLALLRKNPRDVEVLHALGILYAQQENFPDAIQTLEKAHAYQPDNAAIGLHLANALKAQGDFDQAVYVLQKVIADHPDYMLALNNLGTLFHLQGKLTDAIAVYRRVIAKDPAFIDAYYNLGLALLKNNQPVDAIDIYRKLLQQTPAHFAARFHLACILMQQEKTDEALTEFLRIEKESPHHFETESNIAVCYLKKGLLNDAKNHYINALQLVPDDTQILFNLGVIETQLGNMDHAIQYYQKAVRIDPDCFAAHNNLGVAFLAKQHAGLALQHFREALRCQPNNTSLHYTIQALSNNQQIVSAPIDYLRSLFDSYADHYEQHLLNALDYELPAHFNRILNTVEKSKTGMDILDLGCGTGLCGITAKPFAKTLTGVDVSEKMLAIAREKNIYDAIFCEDLNDFLAKTPASFDLIMAGDVLVYMGKLDEFFHKIAATLRPGGLFLFNTEISENEDYKMNQSGRFSHHKNYLESLAQKNHLLVVHYEKTVTRLQNNMPVYGHLYCLKHDSRRSPG